MASVTAGIAKELFRIEIKSPTGNILIADEPIDKGGQNNGFSPKELMASSLAACTCATLRIYANRKEWELLKITATVELVEDKGKTTFVRTIQFEGPLDEEQRNRLLTVANACPVHKILSHAITIETTLL